MKNIEAGNIISYGGMEWIVLDVEQEKVLVLAKESIGNMPFDENGSNNFAKSVLCAYLNGEFVMALEADGADTSAIVPAEDGVDVFLLSVEEYEKYKNVIPNINNWWWLRTPGDDQYRAALVYSGSSVYHCGNYVVYVLGAVRPALWLKRDAVQNRK